MAEKEGFQTCPLEIGARDDGSLETLVIAAYIFATMPRSLVAGDRRKVTDAELVALAVAQAVIGICSDRQFLGVVGKLLPGWFPHLPVAVAVQPPPARR